MGAAASEPADRGGPAVADWRSRLRVELRAVDLDGELLLLDATAGEVVRIDAGALVRLDAGDAATTAALEQLGLLR
jgi:hypothetical protein